MKKIVKDIFAARCENSRKEAARSYERVRQMKAKLAVIKAAAVWSPKEIADTEKELEQISADIDTQIAQINTFARSLGLPECEKEDL